MTREEKILVNINKKDIGLEIGPSHNPIAAKRDGFNVHIIDHMNKADLKKKYAEHNVDLSRIEDVDFIWKGESYAQLTSRRKYYNWIIASHVIEHSPDLVSFLNQCDEVLKEDGVLSLAIPDSRFCFDSFRPITGIGKVLDAYYNKHTIHTPGTAAEYFLNFTKRGGTICWNDSFREEFKLEFTKQNAYENAQAILDQHVYIDLHAWCFTPTSFRLIIQDLNDLGLISLKEVSFFPTYGCEFYISLGRKGLGFQQGRLDALKTIKAEISM